MGDARYRWTTERPQLPTSSAGKVSARSMMSSSLAGFVTHHAKEAVRQGILRVEQGTCHHLLQQQLAHIRHLHGRAADEAGHPHRIGQLGSSDSHSVPRPLPGLPERKQRGG